MGKIYTIANQKGGAGKTTTAHNLAAGLKESGARVLLVDMDSQYNLTTVTGADSDAKGTSELLAGTVKPAAVIQELESGLFIIPGSAALANQSIEVSGLQKALDPLREAFDYIVIDAPPALGQLSAACLVACDEVIIPTSPSVLGAEGVRQLYNGLIEVIQSPVDGSRALNKGLKVAGILINNHSGRTNISKLGAELLEKIAAEEMETKVFESRIRRAAAIQEAEAFRDNIFDYAPKAKITDDYRKFIKELIRG